MNFVCPKCKKINNYMPLEFSEEPDTLIRKNREKKDLL